MQDSEFCNIWVGSDISWWNPWVETKESNLVPPIVVESPDHDDFDRALKSPRMTERLVEGSEDRQRVSQNMIKNHQTER